MKKIKILLLLAAFAAIFPPMISDATDYGFLWTASEAGLVGEKLNPLQAPQKQFQAPAMVEKQVQAPVQAPAKFAELFDRKAERVCFLIPGRANRISRRLDRATDRATRDSDTLRLRATVLEPLAHEDDGLLLESLQPTIPITNVAMVREPGVCGAGGCGSSGCSSGGRRIFRRR